jgi:HSP20 family protein
LREDIDRSFGRFPEEVDFPPLNITRLPEKLVIEALMPDVDRATLDVTTVGNTLTIRGERRQEAAVRPEAYHRRERGFGRFVRTVKLDERVNTESVRAAYRDGILHLELPYAPEATPRKVTVAV